MYKKKNYLILLFLFLINCGYSPIYSQNNKDSNFLISSLNIEGDRVISNYLNASLQRYSNLDRKKIYRIKILTEYDKKTLTKDLTGASTDYELILKTSLEVKRIDQDKSKSYVINFTDRFNMKANDDKYEEQSYERLIKRNLSESVFAKIIFHLTKN